MKHNPMSVLAILSLSFLITACGSKASDTVSESSVAQSVAAVQEVPMAETAVATTQAASTKVAAEPSVATVETTEAPLTTEELLPKVAMTNVEIFGTMYEMPKNWYMEDFGDESKMIYFQDSKPEKIFDVIAITRFPEVLEGTSMWYQAETYVNTLAGSIKASIYSSVDEVVPCNKDKTPGLCILGLRDNGTVYTKCYVFMNNYNDAVSVIYYHNINEGTDHNAEVEAFIDSMDFSYEGFSQANANQVVTNGNTSRSSGSSSFTNKFGNPTTKCAHAGCDNYIASSGDTNCCTTHSKKCLNCGKYIDEDAMYCMDCIIDASNKSSSKGSSSFTNKYGTTTTKCAHAGCDNYIAPSGDTNCCTIHSKKCLNCGKYIDEDAMYCMDCLSGALK